MKVQEWEMWPGLFTIASDDGRVSFERDSTGSLCVEARYTDYTRGLSGQDEMTTQQGEPFAHLTDGELIEIIQKRYDRLPKMKLWQSRPVQARQARLFKDIA